ncbi:hypothetical protein [Chryseobacterium sp. SN22]|nr:hypothetical protein [Chryseobacterium sp. SN22]
MKRIACLLITGSLMTSCVIMKGKNGAPGKPGTSAVSNNSSK